MSKGPSLESTDLSAGVDTFILLTFMRSLILSKMVGIGTYNEENSYALAFEFLGIPEISSGGISRHFCPLFSVAGVW